MVRERVGWQRFSHISVGGGFTSASDDGSLFDEEAEDLLRKSTTDEYEAVPFADKLPVVWAVNAAGVVYRREGIVRENRRGTSWTAVSAYPPMREVSVNGNGQVIWGLSQERTWGGYKIYFREATGRFWIPLGGPGARSISAF